VGLDFRGHAIQPRVEANLEGVMGSVAVRSDTQLKNAACELENGAGAQLKFSGLSIRLKHYGPAIFHK
jgi:hypothetical protein